MNIGIFGGTFDPPHLGHQTVVSEVCRQHLFAEVWYLPVAVHDPQFKKPWMSGAQHRLAMLQLVKEWHVSQGEAVRIETIELDKNLEGFTHRTLRELARRHPEHSFRFIMGSDQLPKLHLWGCDQEKQCFPNVFGEFEWYVYPRGGAPIERLPFSELKVITGVEPVRISSTEIREKARRGETLSNDVLPEVATYIEQHRLYSSTAV
jgi:nicotinate-nucleotide adenylyltransferase